MVDHWFLKWLLIPVSVLFALGVALKNLMYRYGFFNSVQFSVPVISVGNLTVGGSGKTPHVEYLIRLLRPYIRVAVLSRGYGRRSTGFQPVRPQSRSQNTGDEPLIYARKFRDVHVAVSESRSIGIPMLLQNDPSIQLVLLDDAFQHRSVEPYTNILLTEYADPYFKDWPLPVGRLREWRSGARRADVIIVTKCPPELSFGDRQEFIRQLKPEGHQEVFFTTYRYLTPYTILPPMRKTDLSGYDSALIICGIAKPDPILEYVNTFIPYAELVEFQDHHEYTQADMEMIHRRFDALPGSRKVVLTTEKDTVRLDAFAGWLMSNSLPLFALPIEVIFLFDGQSRFESHMQKLLLDFKV